MKKQRGLTLVELMITLVVAGILLAVVAPNFRNMIENNRITTHANAFVTAASTARAEAVRRSDAVELCVSSDGASCTGGSDWSVGWIVRPVEDDDNGEPLRIWDQRSGQPSMEEENGRSRIVFLRDGLADFSGNEDAIFTVDLRSNPCAAEQVRRIEIMRSGRTRVTREAC